MDVENNKILRRQCPICGRMNVENKKIFERDFSSCSDIVAFKRYDVYQCNVCNLVYAGDIEESMPLDDYYEKMSRYEGDNYVISPKLEKHYKFVSSTIGSKLNKGANILDVGCAFGGLLNEFKVNGFENVFGLEPSRKNCDYAMQKYGIKVYQGLLGNNNELNGKKYDLILLNGVLEHLVDVRSRIADCKSLLKEDGLLALTVPDIAMFKEHEDLYQEFSAEHINYFGIDSLNMIMSDEGFISEDYQQDHESLMGLAGNMVTLWRNGGTKHRKENGLLRNLKDSRQELELYMKMCQTFQNKVTQKMEHYDIHGGYYIWGAGTNTAMLIQLGIIKPELIRGVFDSNKNYQGCSAYGHIIEIPQALKTREEYPIIISSQYAFNVIKSAIEDMELKNGIINLFF